MAVAVVAGGHIGGDVRLAQGHRLAVVGIAVMLEAVLVALAAALVAGYLEMAVAGRLDLVGGVAIGADRAARVAFEQQLAVDALVIGFLDADVALAAGLGDVGLVDRRAAVHAALDVVHAVAVVAGGRHDQAHLEHAAAVDAVEVLCGDVREAHPVFVGDALVVMALGAGAGQVQLEHRRVAVLGRQHVVRAVAIVQEAAPDEPIARLTPWMLVA